MRYFARNPVAVVALFIGALCACGTPRTASAAISFVGGCENSAASNPNGNNVTLTLPATDPNDLVIVAYAVGDNDNVDENMAISSPAATFNEVADLFANDTQEVDLGVYWDITDDSYTQVTVTGAGGTDAAVAAVCMVFRGVDTSSPMDVTPVTGTNLNTMHANPGPITHNNPAGIWTVIVGASGHALNPGTTGSYTFPTGYTTDAVDRSADDTSDVTVGIGYRSSGVSNPEDPGVMTHTGTDSTSYAAATTTIALRPSTTVAPTVTTNSAQSFTPTNATLFGSITATGGANATQSGFAYGTASDLSSVIATTTLGAQSGTASFSSFLSGLTANQTYYYRAYATNSGGTGYGQILSFATGNSTATRTIRLFQGYKVKLVSGTMILYQQ